MTQQQHATTTTNLHAVQQTPVRDAARRTYGGGFSQTKSKTQLARHKLAQQLGSLRASLDTPQAPPRPGTSQDYSSHVRAKSMLNTARLIHPKDTQTSAIRLEAAQQDYASATSARVHTAEPFSSRKKRTQSQEAHSESAPNVTATTARSTTAYSQAPSKSYHSAPRFRDKGQKMSVKEMIKLQLMKSEGGNFTVKGYRIPVVHQPYKIKSIAQDAAKLKCFVDIFA